MKKWPLVSVAAALSLAAIACSLQPIPVESPTPTRSPVPPLPTAAPPVSPPPSTSAAGGGLPVAGDLVALYERVSPGVVTIWTFEELGAPHEASVPSGQGSGFVIDIQGHIVTNQHVVNGASEIEVDFPSGIKAWARLLGTDPDSDLAVLEVDVPEETLVPLSLGDSDQVRVGQFVVAIGNPFGLTGTMTVGVVSAIGRTLESERLAPGGTPFSAGDLIQTDAAINPGNSGGPLLNLSGQVIGINRAIQTEIFTVEGSAANSGVGFAVPVNLLRRVAPSLIASGSYDYPYLGISSLDDDLWNLKTIEALGLPPNALGAYVTEVVPGGPADQAGLRGGRRETAIPGLLAGGDLIIAIDDQPVKKFADLLSFLFKYTEPGQQVVLTVIRENEEVDIPLMIGARP